jgi:hypothetical protein
MRRNILKLTMEIQNPNIYSYYKIKSFIKLFDSPFVNFKMQLKDETVNDLKEKIPHEYTGIYTKYTCSEQIIKFIDQRMNKFYDEERDTYVSYKGKL